MSKVKGALFMNLAKMIRENKDKNWDKYLTDGDKQIVYESVMPNSWYPIGVYERSAYAIFMEMGDGKLESAWAWGRFLIEDLGNRFYHNLVKFNDPVGSFERCNKFLNQWLKYDDPDFVPLEVEKISDKSVKIIVRHEKKIPFFEAMVHQVAGSMERIAELNGGKIVKAKIVETKPTKNWPEASLVVAWK